jgi:acyl carrier protein
MKDTLERLVQFVSRQTAAERAVSAGAPLQDHLDSLAMLEFIVFIESEFSIVIPDKDVSPKNFDSLERVAADGEGRRATHAE